MPLHIHCAFIRICVINTRRACEERDAEGVVPYMVCENKRKYTISKICLAADEKILGGKINAGDLRSPLHIHCGVIEPCCHCGFVSSTGERCSPLLWGAWLSERFSCFLFNFQAANEVQEVLFCAIRDFTSASPIHVDRMFPHTLLPRRIFDLG